MAPKSRARTMPRSAQGAASQEEPGPAPPSRWPFSFRETARFAFTATLLFALIEYIRFWQYVQTGAGAAVTRPVVADAFLPLGGLAALKVWLATGFWDPFHPVAIVVVIAVLLTAWLCRRAACSWLCPLGMVSEYLGKLGKKLLGRQIRMPRWLDSTLIGLKYAGTFALLFWICVTPIGSIRDFLATPFYAVADMKLFDVYTAFGLSIIFGVGLVVVMSVLVKSAWCRYLCPYGALQGMFGVLSPIRLVKDDETCTGCARCNRACPNGVDIARAVGTVTSAECMGCTSCVSACPQQGTLELRVGRGTRVEPLAFGLIFIVTMLFVVAVALFTGGWGPGLSPETYRQVLHISANVRLF